MVDEIKCTCGKLLAKRHEDGKIYVWCKECKEEVELGVEPYGSKESKTKTDQKCENS